jgi:hypothetical protein
MPNITDQEIAACVPTSLNPSGFNQAAVLPYGLDIHSIQRAMSDFLDFLGFINPQLHTHNLPRLETFLMPANFSSIVGEFMNMTIPKYYPGLVKNQYHNGHPDLLPTGVHPGNAVQHSTQGIEIKASRHPSGWQGHNVEAVWLIVFVFDSNTSNDKPGVSPKSFCFKSVFAARLDEDDWAFSGRSGTSRRTITASVTQSGVRKMKANWIYNDSTQR